MNWTAFVVTMLTITAVLSLIAGLLWIATYAVDNSKLDFRGVALTFLGILLAAAAAGVAL